MARPRRLDLEGGNRRGVHEEITHEETITMIRTLLATTAVAALLTTGAMAQEATQPAPAAPAATEPATGVPAAVQPSSGYLATNMIGETVYDGTGEQAQNIGSVNDLVIGEDGSIQAVVVGVGGFLGIGQKNVALEYKEISWAEQNGDRWIVIPTSKEALEGLPDFDRRPYDPAPPAAATDTTMAPADQTATAPAPAVPADETAAAPAPAAPADQAAEAPAASDPAMPADETAQAPAANDNAATTDTMSTAAIDKSTLSPFDTAAVRAEDLVGTTVYGADDANVGEIGDVVVSQDGKVDSIIIDVGGFLGMGEKEVAVGMDNLSFMTDKDGNKYLYTNMTKEQLEAQPAYDKSTWAEQRDTQRMMIR
jgi:sporulation protein YlmC with PRC-barrel domain